MSRILTTLLVAVASLLPLAAASNGRLVLVGGGPTPVQVFERTLEMSGGRRTIVAVLPQTYSDDSIADAAVAMWKNLHAADVVKVSRTDMALASAQLRSATLIWMPGGFPGLFMRTLQDTPLPGIIRERFAAGITIGGASAGAVAVCETMIDDESTPDGADVDGGSTAPGLGLWPQAIVSPHFTERRRLHALQAVVAEHPSLLGVGLDEGTAVIVSRDDFEVLGKGTVVIVDPTRQPRSLKSGMRFRYAAKRQ